MAEVMKYEDFKEEGSEAAVKVSSPSFAHPFLYMCHLSKSVFHWEEVPGAKQILTATSTSRPRSIFIFYLGKNSDAPTYWNASISVSKIGQFMD